MADSTDVTTDAGKPAQRFRGFGGIANIDFTARHRLVDFFTLRILHPKRALIGFLGKFAGAFELPCFDGIDNFIDLAVQDDFNFGQFASLTGSARAIVAYDR